MMKIPKAILLLPIFSFVTINTLWANVKTDQSLVKGLSFEEYIKIITKKLPNIKNNAIEVQKSQNTLYGAGSVDDIKILGSITHYDNNNFSVADHTDTYSSKKYEGNLALQKKFSHTGTSVETGIQYSQVQEQITNNGNKYYRPVAYVEISQPILNNAFGVVDRFSKNDAVMKLKIAQIKKKELDELDINYYKTLYYQWIVQKEKLILLERSLKNSKVLKKQMVRKAQSGLADNDDLQEAIASVLNYEQQYKINEIAYNQIKKEIEIFVNAQTPTVDYLELKVNQIEKKQFTTIPFSETRNTEIYELSKENLVYKKGVTKNKLLPELNFFGGYNKKSSNNSFDSAVNNMTESDVYIGISVSIPLGNISAKQELKDVALEIDQINQEYLISKNLYQKNINNLLASIKGYKQILDIKKSKLKSLKSKLITQDKKYKGGRLNLRYVLETSDLIVSEKIDILDIKNSLISYSIAFKDLTN